MIPMLVTSVGRALTNDATHWASPTFSLEDPLLLSRPASRNPEEKANRRLDQSAR